MTKEQKKCDARGRHEYHTYQDDAEVYIGICRCGCYVKEHKDES
jgi:hypothetical protein